VRGKVDMKFDFLIGNPPYGKNSNLAIKFLNLGVKLSTQVRYVLPRTFRKVSVHNRIDARLHLVHDQTVPDHMFPDSIVTCYQVWEARTLPRLPVQKTTHHKDLEFVAPAQANVCVGRVGGGPCGKVFVSGFLTRSINSHYFIRTSDEVIAQLQKLSDQFRQAGLQTVGVPSLSKHELIEIYTQHVTGNNA